MELGFYKVVVSVEVEQENGKTKKHKEKYIVTDCSDPKRAAAVIEEEFKFCMDEWTIESVKVEKLDGILNALKSE